MNGEEHRATTEEPPRDLHCPECDYSLRGLRGRRITCPECGSTCDPVEMLSRYRRHWADTPLYQRVSGPGMYLLVIAILSPFIIVLPLVIGAFAGRSASLIVAGVIAFVLLITWGCLVASGLRRSRQPGVARLMLLAHAASFGYMLGAYGLLGVLVMSFLAAEAVVIEQWYAGLLAVAVLFSPCGLCVVVLVTLRLSFLLDRHVGRRCVEAMFATDHETVTTPRNAIEAAK